MTYDLRAILQAELDTIKNNYEIEVRTAKALVVSSNMPSIHDAQNLTTMAMRMSVYAAKFEQTQRILSALDE